MSLEHARGRYSGIEPEEDRTGEPLTAAECEEDQHQDSHQTVDYAQMNQGEDVERFTAPAIGLVEPRFKLGPEYMIDPVVTEGEPGKKKCSEGR